MRLHDRWKPSANGRLYEHELAVGVRKHGVVGTRGELRGVDRQRVERGRYE
jgi:hypothetical protein